VVRGVLAGLVSVAAFALSPAMAHAKKDLSDPATGFVDPRKRPLPPMHRFRLGLGIGYVRLSSAIDADTDPPVTQRFHYIPFELDFAYQLQFLKYMMLRPSLGIGPNLGNSLEAMPMVIHPQFHFGYQGAIVGAGVGYGFLAAPIQRKDVTSAARGGLGQPVYANVHHIGAEFSITTRVDKGALSFIFRIAGANGHLMHFDLDKGPCKSCWKALVMFNFGWYFGDGSKQKKWQRDRELRRSVR
jgi:hypothetical protein